MEPAGSEVGEKRPGTSRKFYAPLSSYSCKKEGMETNYGGQDITEKEVVF